MKLQFFSQSFNTLDAFHNSVVHESCCVSRTWSVKKIKPNRSLKKSRLEAVLFVVNNMELSDQKKSAVDKHIELEIPVYIDNIVVKTEDTQSMKSMSDDIHIKLEPFEQRSEDTYYNIYDSKFEVFKHEPDNELAMGSLFTSSAHTHASPVGATKQEMSEQGETCDNDISESDVDSKGVHFQTLSQYELLTLESPNIEEPTFTTHTTVDKLRSIVDTNVKKIKRRKNILRSHSRKHVEEKMFICDMCQRVCKRKHYLSNHIKSHYKKFLNCKICTFQCRYNSDMIRHMHTHADDKPFACELCPYKCTQKYNLYVHMRSHTGERPYTCKLCQYKFARKGSLVEHMRTHSGEKTENCYACTLCQYSCIKKCNLMRHMRTHSGDKPFACDLCQYRSADSSSLARHAMTHSGEKPFACQSCSYTSSRTGNLATHVRRVHSKR